MAIRVKGPIGSFKEGQSIQINIRKEHPVYSLVLAERQRLEKECGVTLSWPQVLESVFKKLTGK